MSVQSSSMVRPGPRPLLALGGGLLAAAAACAVPAAAHMRDLGLICGAGFAPHCAWCDATEVLAAAGALSLALGLRSTSEPSARTGNVSGAEVVRGAKLLPSSRSPSVRRG